MNKTPQKWPFFDIWKIQPWLPKISRPTHNFDAIFYTEFRATGLMGETRAISIKSQKPGFYRPVKTPKSWLFLLHFCAFLFTYSIVIFTVLCILLTKRLRNIRIIDKNKAVYSKWGVKMDISPHNMDFLTL